VGADGCREAAGGGDWKGKALVQRGLRAVVRLGRGVGLAGGELVAGAVRRRGT
jgi:hypothetical protein